MFSSLVQRHWPSPPIKANIYPSLTKEVTYITPHDTKYDTYREILKVELAQTMGCTELIAVANCPMVVRPVEG